VTTEQTQLSAAILTGILPLRKNRVIQNKEYIEGMVRLISVLLGLMYIISFNFLRRISKTVSSVLQFVRYPLHEHKQFLMQVS
jgi:hypothetical protein